MYRFKTASALLAGSLVLVCSFSQPAGAIEECAPVAVQEQLDRGEIIVGLETIGDTKYVTGRMIIDQPPSKVWPIMVNPFEFQHNITPRMKKVDVITDRINYSVLKVTMDAFPIPDLTYMVESDYKKVGDGARIDFRRIGGVLKDFHGHWLMNPSHGGAKTELVYSMYIDPGFFVPQWIVRKGVSGELPKTLKALRFRVQNVTANTCKSEKQTIMAATPLHMH